MGMMFWIWLALLGLFIAVEAATVALVSVWFIGGAAVALVLSLLGTRVWVQCVAFIAVSVILLLLLRPFLKKYVSGKKVATNVNAFIGKHAVVTETIDNLQGKGAIRVDGSVWTARSANEAPIGTGTVVTICKIEGVKAFVEPETNKEETV